MKLRAKPIWAVAILVVMFAATPARSQDSRTPTPQMSRADARAYMTDYVSRHPRMKGCGSPVMSGIVTRITAAEISETGITLTCEHGRQQVITFADMPHAEVLPHNVYVGPPNEGANRPVGKLFIDVEDTARFVEAWAALQIEPPIDPANDATFQASLRQASSADRTEDQRRAQVRAEAFVGAGRAADALQVYQTELAVSPGWAFGHYNAALIAAELHNYTLAITEMRRYLYLQPNASDARAAQDQIYRWEALLE